MRLRENKADVRYHELKKLYNHDDGRMFPHDLDEKMDQICNYVSLGLWCDDDDWFDKLSLRYVW